MNMHHFYHRVFQAAFLTCLLAPLCACGASSLKTGFNVTGGMEVNRFGHTATLLNDGRVLFTGGTDDSGQSTATAEVYDPATGGRKSTRLNSSHLVNSFAVFFFNDTAPPKISPLPLPDALPISPLCACGASSLKTGFNVPGGMEVNRFGHTATLLNDGRVLFTGGTDAPGQSPATAEVYDPATGRFHLVGSMTSPREGHVATLLKSGRVLVVGGGLNSSTSSILNSAELYDPTTDTFTATRSMLTGRTGAAATLLADGRVLLTGGIGPTPTADAIDSTEIYDPAAQTFLSAAHMTTVRVNHVATLLTSGEVLVAG